MKRKLIRPGDIIRLTTTRFGTKLKGKKYVVTEARYTNGVRFATFEFAWVDEGECKRVGRASDKQFLKALRSAELADE